jgi:hypothetical protein
MAALRDALVAERQRVGSAFGRLIPMIQGTCKAKTDTTRRTRLCDRDLVVDAEGGEIVLR